MNLTKLFEAQKELDEHIVKEKGLESVDLLDKKILALQVELGELANEWRGFKFWSDRQTPKLEYHYITTGGISGQMDREPTSDEGNELFSRDMNEPMTIKNPMLEEYVDCLHFILSIGNDLGIRYIYMGRYGVDISNGDTVSKFSTLYNNISNLRSYVLAKNNHRTMEELEEGIKNVYELIVLRFIILGRDYLGFTWGQIEQAYFDKNKVNHERQGDGY